MSSLADQQLHHKHPSFSLGSSQSTKEHLSHSDQHLSRCLAHWRSLLVHLWEPQDQLKVDQLLSLLLAQPLTGLLPRPLSSRAGHSSSGFLLSCNSSRVSSLSLTQGSPLGRRLVSRHNSSVLHNFSRVSKAASTSSTRRR